MRECNKNIAQKLTKRKIKTPASYYNYVWNTKCSTECISQEYGVWVDTTIKAILTNRIYVGAISLLVLSMNVSIPSLIAIYLTFLFGKYFSINSPVPI